MTAELTAALNGLGVAALAALTALVTVLGIFGAQYVRTLIEDRREAVEERRRLRLAQAGIEAAAAVDEETRGANALPLTASDKLDRAVAKLASEPIAADLSRPALVDIVHRGVATLRGSLPYPTTYRVSPSVAPPVEVLTGVRGLPPPARVPGAPIKGDK